MKRTMLLYIIILTTTASASQNLHFGYFQKHEVQLDCYPKSMIRREHALKTNSLLDCSAKCFQLIPSNLIGVQQLVGEQHKNGVKENCECVSDEVSATQPASRGYRQDCILYYSLSFQVEVNPGSCPKLVNHTTPSAVVRRRWKDHCYYISIDTKPFNMSSTACEDGDHAFSIDNTNMWYYVQALVKSTGVPMEKYWTNQLVDNNHGLAVRYNTNTKKLEELQFTNASLNLRVLCQHKICKTEYTSDASFINYYEYKDQSYCFKFIPGDTDGNIFNNASVICSQLPTTGVNPQYVSAEMLTLEDNLVFDALRKYQTAETYGKMFYISNNGTNGNNYVVAGVQQYANKCTVVKFNSATSIKPEDTVISKHCNTTTGYICALKIT